MPTFLLFWSQVDSASRDHDRALNNLVFHEAMRLIKVEGLSQREASQRAGTEHSFSASRCENIRRRIGRALTPQESKPRPRLLDDKMEEMLYSVVQAFSTLANPLGTTEVQVLAQALSGMDQVPSTGWVQKFLIRHGNEIALRKGKKSHKRKDLLATFTSVKQWTEDTSNVLKGLALQPSLVFNIDETRAVPASKTVSVLAHKHMTETHYNQTIDSALYTLVSCIAADGTTLFCLYMFKYIPNKNGLRHSVYLPVEAPKRVSRRKHDYPVYIAVSPKGYMNGELWQETMKIFIELAGVIGRVSVAKNRLYCLLTAAHLTFETGPLLIWVMRIFPPFTSQRIAAMYCSQLTEKCLRTTSKPQEQIFKVQPWKQASLVNLRRNLLYWSVYNHILKQWPLPSSRQHLETVGFGPGTLPSRWPMPTSPARHFGSK